MYVSTQIRPRDNADYRVWAQLAVTHVCIGPRDLRRDPLVRRARQDCQRAFPQHQGKDARRSRTRATWTCPAHSPPIADVGYQYMLMPDHVPQIDGRDPSGVTFAYRYGYIKALLDALAP